MRIFRIVLLLIVSSAAIARAEDPKLPKCESYGGMGAVLETGNYEQAQVCLNEFSFSKDPAVAAKEAGLVARVCAKFIPPDQEGTNDEFCYDLYNSNPKAMKAGWAQLSPKQRAIVEKSYRQTQKVMKHGNGG